jgi:enamine deaminase RidA (YjgF/YER057c/UK114 family)
MSTAIQPEGWAKPSGYSNGIVATGKVLYVAGQIGWNPKSAAPAIPPTMGFVEQFDQALGNVCEVVRAAGGKPEHIVRLTIYVTDKKEYLGALKETGAAWKKHLGRHFPAVALLQISALVEDNAKVEIEATAVLES